MESQQSHMFNVYYNTIADENLKTITITPLYILVNKTSQLFFHSYKEFKRLEVNWSFGEI